MSFPPQMVSLFPNAFAKKPSNVALGSVLADIRGHAWRAAIMRLRSLPPADYDREKRNLPAFTISGTCVDRKIPDVHSGLLQIDLDNLNGSLESLRSRLINDPHVRFGFVSPSGNGLKLGLTIDGSRHDESFDAAESYFATTYGVSIDPKVKDRLRLCFVSHDPQLWENPQAKNLPRLYRVGGVVRSHKESGDVCLSPCSDYSVKLGGVYSVKSLDDAVKISLPTAARRNNRSLFHLARALLVLGSLSQSERMSAFESWFAQTQKLGFLRDGQTRDHYLAEFLNAMKTAQIPLSESPIDAAWRKAKSEPLPAEAATFGSQTLIQVAALCLQIELSSQGNPWFLSCRDAARVVGISHTQAAAWLAGLVTLGLLSIAEPGTKQRATRYKWMGAKP